jgi:hypothetical protein
VDSSVPGHGPVAGFCEDGNEPLGSEESDDFLDQVDLCSDRIKTTSGWLHVERKLKHTSTVFTVNEMR